MKVLTHREEHWVDFLVGLTKEYPGSGCQHAADIASTYFSPRRASGTCVICDATTGKDSRQYCSPECRAVGRAVNAVWHSLSRSQRAEYAWKSIGQPTSRAPVRNIECEGLIYEAKSNPDSFAGRSIAQEIRRSCRRPVFEIVECPSCGHRKRVPHQGEGASS